MEFSLAAFLILLTLGHSWPQKISRTLKLDMAEKKVTYFLFIKCEAAAYQSEQLML